MAALLPGCDAAAPARFDGARDAQTRCSAGSPTVHRSVLLPAIRLPLALLGAGDRASGREAGPNTSPRAAQATSGSRLAQRQTQGALRPGHMYTALLADNFGHWMLELLPDAPRMRSHAGHSARHRRAADRPTSNLSRCGSRIWMSLAPRRDALFGSRRWRSALAGISCARTPMPSARTGRASLFRPPATPSLASADARPQGRGAARRRGAGRRRHHRLRAPRAAPARRAHLGRRAVSSIPPPATSPSPPAGATPARAA